MLISEQDSARRLLFVVLITANVLLYSGWPWLRSLPLISDSAEPSSGKNIMRNELYIKWFFDALRSQKQILFLGTSESTSPYNLAAQVNELAPDKPRMISYAKAGLSPIHSALLVAKWESEGLVLPPLVLVINPVYFTRAYDEINDGWLNLVVRSPVFLQMNHNGVCGHIATEALAAYNKHFRLWRLLYPAKVQEYLGNLFYLLYHQVPGETNALDLAVPSYRFTGKFPVYDERRNVWKSSAAPDRFDKRRWVVRDSEESVNLKGLSSIIMSLRTKPVPVLLVVLPVNRKFYEYHGLDMPEFDQRYRGIRADIRRLSQGERTFLLDLYELPQLDRGFKDRMHMDEYGFFQLARFILQSPEYGRFMQAVGTYYQTTGSTAEQIAE